MKRLSDQVENCEQGDPADKRAANFAAVKTEMVKTGRNLIFSGRNMVLVRLKTFFYGRNLIVWPSTFPFENRSWRTYD